MTPPPRTRNPKGEGDRLRRDLLDAAADLMGETGEEPSLRAVAARAGVSPTAVYAHFDDHVDLLRAAVIHCWREFEIRLDEGADAGDDPFTAFRSAGEAYVAFATGEHGKYRVLFSTSIDLGFEGDVGGVAFDKLVARVGAILSEKGDVRDPVFVAIQVHTWIHGMVDLMGPEPSDHWPPVAVLLDELALRLGLAADG